MKKLLMTGFEPFANDKINPSWEGVKGVTAPEGIELYKCELPVVYGKTGAALRAAIEELRPDAVICVGLAAGCSALNIERVALNVDDARIPDNEGNMPVDLPIFEDGPVAFLSALPIRRIEKALTEAGIPARISNSAGTFLCNNAFYNLRYLIEHEYPAMLGGFIHVPALPEMKDGLKEGTFLMERAELVRGLQTAADTVAAALKELP